MAATFTSPLACRSAVSATPLAKPIAIRPDKALSSLASLVWWTTGGGGAGAAIDALGELPKPPEEAAARTEMVLEMRDCRTAVAGLPSASRERSSACASCRKGKGEVERER